MAHAPEGIAAKPMTVFRAELFAMLVHELRPNALTIDVLAGGGIDGVDPNDKGRAFQIDFSPRILRGKSVAQALGKPRAEVLHDERFPADTMAKAKGRLLNLQNPPIREL